MEILLEINKRGGLKRQVEGQTQVEGIKLQNEESTVTDNKVPKVDSLLSIRFFTLLRASSYTL